MKVYIVRHGETMENASNCLVGRINSSLTEEGIRQAKQVRDYFKDKNIKYERAESVKDLYDRAVKVLTDLKKDYDDKSIVVVTHSGIIRVLYYYFNGIPEDGALGEVTIKNCGVYEYDL